MKSRIEICTTCTTGVAKVNENNIVTFVSPIWYWAVGWDADYFHDYLARNNALIDWEETFYDEEEKK